MGIPDKRQSQKGETEKWLPTPAPGQQNAQWADADSDVGNSSQCSWSPHRKFNHIPRAFQPKTIFALLIEVGACEESAHLTFPSIDIMHHLMKGSISQQSLQSSLILDVHTWPNSRTQSVLPDLKSSSTEL